MKCVVCTDAGCEFCPRVKAYEPLAIQLSSPALALLSVGKVKAA